MSKPWQNSYYCMQLQAKLTPEKYEKTKELVWNIHIDIKRCGGFGINQKLDDLYEQLAMIMLYYEMEHGLFPF